MGSAGSPDVFKTAKPTLDWLAKCAGVSGRVGKDRNCTDGGVGEANMNQVACKTSRAQREHHAMLAVPC